MQLKMSPDKVTLMANAIENHIMAGDAQENTDALNEVLTWLRYRLSKWNTTHPDTTVN